jgi:hypothetical protein
MTMPVAFAPEPMPAKRERTLGEHRVRTSFNPSNQGAVDIIKQRTAALIDDCQDLLRLDQDTEERRRLVALAQTAYEEAAMWAVKAATA